MFSDILKFVCAVENKALGPHGKGKFYFFRK
jgi:hypothetical protein